MKQPCSAVFSSNCGSTMTVVDLKKKHLW